MTTTGAPTLTDAKRRVIERLKRAGPATAGALAKELALTDVAVRQHLAALEEHGLVDQRASRPTGPGRPAVTWSLTPLANDLFPDRHADLTVDLIAATREAMGDEGLQRVIETRTADQLRGYRKVVGGSRKRLRDRVDALARQRTAEGYMAEVVDDDSGLFLVENHCPICDAARACVGFCRSELELFQMALGDDVLVERTEHLLSGDRRCVYRISRR